MKILIYGGLLLTLLNSCSESSSVFCDPSCSADSTCIDGECVVNLCTQDDECGAQRHCVDQQCALLIECMNDGECEQGRCVEGKCFANECEEGNTQVCTTLCGMGEQLCVGGVWRACSAATPIEELCSDQIDNDCDGEIDEQCIECEANQSQMCETACGMGEEICIDGMWAMCTAPQVLDDGTCPCEDGMSETCETMCGMGVRLCEAGRWSMCTIDGVICECLDGESRECMNACGSGEEICEQGQWSECIGVSPQVEVCFDMIDQDCDGIVDEDCEGCQATTRFMQEGYQIIAGAQSVIESTYTGGKFWVAVSNRMQSTPIYLDQVEETSTVGAWLDLRIGFPVMLFDWGGSMGLLSIHQGRLGLSRHSNSNNPPIFEQNYSFSNSALNATAVLGNQEVYLIWSENLQDLYLQRVSIQGELNGDTIQLTNAIGRSLYPSAVVNANGVSIAFIDERDQDPSGDWIYILDWDPNSPTRSPQLTRFIQGSYPQLLWSRSVYTLVYLQENQGIYELMSVQWNTDQQILADPQVLYRSAIRMSDLQVITTTTGYHVGWSLDKDDTRLFKSLALNEQAQAVSTVVNLGSVDSSHDYDMSLAENKALVVWTEVSPDLEGLIPEDIQNVNLLEISTQCADSQKK